MKVTRQGENKDDSREKYGKGRRIMGGCVVRNDKRKNWEGKRRVREEQ